MVQKFYPWEDGKFKETVPKPHPHAAMITAWVQDTNRKVEYKCGAKWYEFPDSLDDRILRFDKAYDWRFADEVPEPVNIGSPLSDEEICDVWNKSNIIAKNVVGYQHQLREIAIAAKIATLKEVAAMPSKTTLLEKDLLDIYMDDVTLVDVANATIAEFQAQLLKQLGE